jgi:hypothetical protein
MEKKETRFPSWFPTWARELGRVYFTGTTSMFLLHGNVDDLVRVEDRDAVDYRLLPEFLGSQIFGSWDVVLHYDMTRPPRALAGRSKERLAKINAQIERYIGKLEELPQDPPRVIAVLNRFLELMLVGKSDADRPSIALVLDYAQMLVPSTAVSHTSRELATNLATLLNWAKNPYIKRVNFAFCLISEKLSDLNEALVRNAHTQRLELSFPDRTDRLAFIDWVRAGRSFDRICEVPAEMLADLTAGLTLVNLQSLLQGAVRGGQTITLAQLKQFK